MINPADVSSLNTALNGASIALVVSFILTIYSVWLNYKQAKVKEQMTELINVMKSCKISLEGIDKNVRNIRGDN